MPRYFRIEAVNLDHILHDTNDLSTRRAGGYLLLEAIHKVAEETKALLQPISLGASIGLFELKLGQAPQAAHEKINEVLAGRLYALATFIVKEHNDATCDWPVPVETMLAQTRWQQMQSLSFDTCFYPATEDGAPVKPDNEVRELSDHLDGKRPAILRHHYSSGDDDKPYSHSVHLRREEGRRLRQDFYGRELGLAQGNNDLVFTNSFEELARFPKAGDLASDAARKNYHALPPNLDNKIALFYADGNSFSKHVRACQSPQELREFDAQNIEFRRSFLRRLVHTVQSHPLGWSQTKIYDEGQPARTVPARRLETLMWGGDEFLFVVPAWLGLELAQLFFEVMQPLQWKGKPLTFSAALVFAHHNAPIARLENLAKYGVAEQGKCGSLHGQNSLNWIVLESFDHAGMKVGDYWKERDLGGVTWQRMALSPQHLKDLITNGHAVKDAMPRSSVYRALQLLRLWSKKCSDNNPPGTQSPFTQAQEELLRRTYGNIGDAMTNSTEWALLWQSLPSKPDPWKSDWPPERDAASPPGSPDFRAEQVHKHLAAWLLLSELWDYLPPPSPLDDAVAPECCEGGAA